MLTVIDLFPEVSLAARGLDARVPRYRWLKWLLNKLGLMTDTYYVCDTRYERITVDCDSIQELMMVFLRDVRRKRPDTLVVSGDAMNGLITSQERIGQQITLPCQVHGVKIIYSPYLEGTNVLPLWND